MSRYNRSSISGIGFPPWTRAVKTLVIACVIAFILEQFDRIAGGASIVSKFGLTPALVIQSHYLWQLVTYIFLHDGITHILFNMLGLWMFGSDLELSWGPREFTKFFFFCGIGGGLLTLVLSPSLSTTIGASGAIYGILLAYGMMFPNRIIYLIMFPIPAKWMVVIFGGIAFFSSLTGSSGRIAYSAHLGGMLFGFLYLKGGNLLNLRQHYDRWRRNRLRKKFDVYNNDRKPDDNPRWRRWQ